MQYIPCNSALLAQKTLFLTQKGTVFQIYKSFGIWEDPPPCWEKFPNDIVFFLERTLISKRKLANVFGYLFWEGRSFHACFIFVSFFSGATTSLSTSPCSIPRKRLLSKKVAECGNNRAIIPGSRNNCAIILQ